MQILYIHSFFICFILFIFTPIFKCIPSIKQLDSVRKTAKLQLNMHQRVPYLDLHELCNAELKQNSMKEIPQQLLQWESDQEIQFQQIQSYYEQSNLNVLLDTGSTQFWLADTMCRNCPRTKPLCPHLSNSDQKISYIKGYIEGINSYINVCGNIMKFLCVKAAQNLGEINGEGIMGLKGQSLGLNVIFRIFKKKIIQGQQYKKSIKKLKDNKSLQVQQILQRQKLSFKFGHWFNELQLSVQNVLVGFNSKEDLKNIHVVPKLSNQKLAQSNKNWSLMAHSISIFNDTIIIEDTLSNQTKAHNKLQIRSQDNIKNGIQAFVDSGASKIVFPGFICLEMMEKMKTILNIECRLNKKQGIDCNKQLNQIDLKIYLKSYSSSNANQKLQLLINDQIILDNTNNRLNIHCQFSMNQKSELVPSPIILGYPLFASYEVTYIIEKQIKKKSTDIYKKQNKYKINFKPIDYNQYDRFVNGFLKSMMLIYCILISLLGFASISVINYVRDKRSKKIII